MNRNDQNIRSFFRKDQDLENVLKELNESIEPTFGNEMTMPQRPIILVVGTPRSGSTLVMQYLSSLGIFSYPTNLIARFYSNPHFGIRVQQALAEFDSKNQLGFNDVLSFRSDLGKTTGALQPSEFWYFWRYHLSSFLKDNFSSNDRDFELNQFLKKLSAFETLTGKIPIMKGLIMYEYLAELFHAYGKFIFVDLERDPIDNAASLLDAREKYFGDTSKWYSFKPKACKSIAFNSEMEEVASQVYHIRQSINKALDELPEQNVLRIHYEDFCDSPFGFTETLVQQLGYFDEEIDLRGVNPELSELKFEVKTRRDTGSEVIDSLKKAFIKIRES